MAVNRRIRERYSVLFVLFVVCTSLMADGPQRARFTNLSYCNVTILSSVTACAGGHYNKNLPISPRFSPYDFFIAMQVQQSYNSSRKG